MDDGKDDGLFMHVYRDKKAVTDNKAGPKVQLWVKSMFTYWVDEIEQSLFTVTFVLENVFARSQEKTG